MTERLYRRRFVSAAGVGSITFLTGCFGQTSETAGPGGGSWPTFKFDQARTGYNPDGYGPTKEVEVAWQSSLDGLGFTSPTVLESSLFVGSFGHDSGTVTAIDTETGDVEWTTSFPSAVQAPPSVAEEGLYVADDKGHLAGLALDGERRWETDTGTEIHSALAVVDGQIYVGGIDTGAPGSNCDSIVMIDEVDPEVPERNWRYDFNEGYVAAPAVADETVYVGSNGAYALDPGDGGLLWRYRTEGRSFNTPAVADALYASSWDGIIHAVSNDDGTHRWTFKTGGDSRSSPAVADGTVLVGSHDGNLYAIGADDGEERWRVTTDGKVQSAPSVVGDTVYAASTDRTIYAAALSDGSVRWTQTVDGEITTTPAVTDGAVYVVDELGTVYALAEP